MTDIWIGFTNALIRFNLELVDLSKIIEETLSRLYTSIEDYFNTFLLLRKKFTKVERNDWEMRVFVYLNFYEMG